MDKRFLTKLFLLAIVIFTFVPTKAFAGEEDSVVNTETQETIDTLYYSLSEYEYIYNGKVRTPEVTVKNSNDEVLYENTDYTISYASDRQNVGRYSVNVSLMGKYAGEKTLYFDIVQAKASSFVLSTYAYTYDGKAKTPAVIVKNSEKTVLSSEKDYTVSYASNRKDIGKYTVKISLKGNYTGKEELSFKINPKGTSLTSLSKGSRAITAKWKKQSLKTTGYQLIYSSYSNFKSYKTVTIPSYKTTSKKVSGLQSKERYYVKVRTYKSTGGSNYYSSWSGTWYTTTETVTRKLSLGAKGAVIMRVEDGTIMYSKNMNKRLPNASTTKMMTALLCLENNSMNEVVKFTKYAADTRYKYLKVKAGERITVGNLLNSMMICSSNDSATAISEHISKRVSKFAELMNKRAKELGCKNTHFVNPHGLDNSKHYSSAYDLTLIQKKCIQEPEYLKIIASKTFKYQNVAKTKTFSGTTTNKLLGKYAGMLGGKTGYTTKAGYCFCGLYNYNGVRYIYTVLGNSKSNGRWDDCKKIMSYIKYL